MTETATDAASSSAKPSPRWRAFHFFLRMSRLCGGLLPVHGCIFTLQRIFRLAFFLLPIKALFLIDVRALSGTAEQGSVPLVIGDPPWHLDLAVVLPLVSAAMLVSAAVMLLCQFADHALVERVIRRIRSQLPVDITSGATPIVMARASTSLFANGVLLTVLTILLAGLVAAAPVFILVAAIIQWGIAVWVTRRWWPGLRKEGPAGLRRLGSYLHAARTVVDALLFALLFLLALWEVLALRLDPFIAIVLIFGFRQILNALGGALQAGMTYQSLRFRDPAAIEAVCAAPLDPSRQ